MIDDAAGDRVASLRERLAASSGPVERIALYNDPGNGSIAERLLAATGHRRCGGCHGDDPDCCFCGGSGWIREPAR